MGGWSMKKPVFQCPFKQIKILRRYRFAILALIIFIISVLSFPEIGVKANASMVSQIKTMLLILPPIFIILGLLDIWVPREIMIKLMGPSSGIKGPLLAFGLGTAAAGPLYAAFPVASMLMKKGVSFFNLMVFVGAWSCTKIPMLLFEMKSLGYTFALSRLAIDIVGIIFMAFAIKALVPQKEIDRIYKKAEERN